MGTGRQLLLSLAAGSQLLMVRSPSQRKNLRPLRMFRHCYFLFLMSAAYPYDDPEVGSLAVCVPKAQQSFGEEPAGGTKPFLNP